jgi:hypothetical protein
MLFAMHAKLFKLQPVFKSFLVLSGEIIDALANTAFHFYQIVLRHNVELLLILKFTLWVGKDSNLRRREPTDLPAEAKASFYYFVGRVGFEPTKP